MIRVLLAEDQAMVRGALSALLGLEEDIEVVAEVARGDEVVAAARTALPDVALLDIEMPGMNGFEFIRRIRQINPTIKALLMSAFEFNNNERSSALGSIIVDGFVQKPVPPRKLTSIVQRHIVKARSYYNTSM